MTAHGDGSWQRLTSSGWSSVGESSTLYELAFQSTDHNGTSAVGIYLIDFLNMADITTSYQPIRRLSSKELPEITYEWEESDRGASVWTPYSTDESEAINISSKSGRTKITLYIGHHNTSYEIDLQRQTQLNKLTNSTRWIRSVRPVYFSASPSALSPSSSGVQRQGLSALQESIRSVIEGARHIVDLAVDDTCPICLEAFNPSVPAEQAWELRECSNHYFHAACIEVQLARTGKCAVCSKAYIVQTGNQPLSGIMTVDTWPAGNGADIAGHDTTGVNLLVDIAMNVADTIVICYDFPPGIQGPDHPNPGRRYYPTVRYAFLPDIPEGREVLRLLRICFQRRLTFTVGRSLTTGLDNSVVWNGVHHKTSPSGGTIVYGWPDPTYFLRVKEELKLKGIVSS